MNNSLEAELCNPDSIDLFIHSFSSIASAPGSFDKLRGLLLDLAMHGRLVDQNPQDEPASVLIDIIAQKRAKFLEEKRTRSVKELEPIESEQRAYDLPQGWEWIKLGHVVEMFNGRAFKSTEWSDSGLPIVRIQNLNDPSAMHNYFEGDLDEKHLIDSGTLLISWSGTPGTSFGAFIWEDGPAALNQHINKCQLHGPVDLEFMKLAINSCMDHLIEQAHGGVGLKHVTKGVLNNLIFALPPLEEQKRIVAKVDQLMALCDKLEAQQQEQARTVLKANTTAISALTNSAEEEFEHNWKRIADNFNTIYGCTLPMPPDGGRQKKYVVGLDNIRNLRFLIQLLGVEGRLTRRISGGMSPVELLEIARERRLKQTVSRKKWSFAKLSDSEAPFEVPSEWMWTRIYETALAVTVGYVGSMKKEYVDSGVPFYRSQNVRPNRFTREGEVYIAREFHEKISKSAIEGNDVVVVRSGNVGVSCVIPSDISEANCSDLVIIKQPIALLPQYISYYLNSSASSKIQSGTVGIALTHYNTKSVASLPIPLPPLEEQKLIISRIDNLSTMCDQLEKQLTLAYGDAERLLEASVKRLVG